MYNLNEKKTTPWMDELKRLDEESYIDIMMALKEKVDNDITIPINIKKKANNVMGSLVEILLEYSA